MSQFSANQQHRGGKRKAKRLAVTAALSTAAALVGVSAPASASTSGNERLLVVYTFPSHSDTGKAIATGLVSGVGTVQGGGADPFTVTVSLSKGDLYFSGTSTSHSENINPRSCVDRLSGTDSLQVTGGTGVFTGATGTGADAERAVLVAGRNSDGSCNLDAPPVEGTDLIHVTLNLTLRG